MKKLYQHQQNLINKNPKKHLLAWGTGTGKTFTALSLAQFNRVDALIIVPKMLKENWQRAVEDFPDRKHLILTKEEFKRDVQNGKLLRHDAIIIDEAHYFSGIKSQLTKCLQKYIKINNPNYIWALTATPYLSTPWNIFTLANHIGHQLNYMSFRTKYFNDVRIGHRMIPMVKKGAEKELALLVKSIGSTVKLEDCIDVPEQIYETEYYKLSKGQMSVIKSLSDTEHITRWTHTHTIENGLLLSDGYTETQTFECEKTERIKQICEENDKVAVFCRYNKQIELLLSELKNCGKPVFVINGDVKDRDAVVQKVESLDKCIILIQASCSEGYELPSIGVIVFASLSFSYKDYVQSCGRFLRINKPKKNVFIHLVIKGGVDEDVYECIMKKQDFSIALYNK